MENAEQINQLASAFQGSRVLLTAFELELFTALEKGEMDSATLAGKLDTDTRATDRLLNVLCSLGLINKKNNLFSNAPAASRHLVKGKPGYLAGLSHRNNLWDTWTNLTGAVYGDEKKKEAAKKKKQKEWSESFIRAMHTRAHASAPGIVAQIDLQGVKRVLDVGGGSGAFSIQFVKQGVNLKASVFDLPHVVEMTKRYVSEAGVEASFDFLPGDYNQVESFGSGYDLAFLCAIIHINSPQSNQKLVQKCFDALQSGGRLVINDFIMDEDRINPQFGAFFALNMLVGTAEGDTYTESEIRSWYEKAGFRDVKRLEPLGPGTSIIGSKP